MKEVRKEFRALKAINKAVRDKEEWTPGPISIIAPFSWLDNLEAALPLAARQRIMSEVKGNMGVMKVSGGSWAVCHLDTGTIVKQVTSDIDTAKAEAERYGEIFDSLADPILTLGNVQDVIKQVLSLDELREQNPESLQMELN